MKNLFLILLLSAFCLAQTKMYIKKNNNQVDSIPISEISKITFNYSGTIPTDSLVAYYPFNGNANDESGNGNHGSVNGVTLTTDRFGGINKAYSFDGVDDFIQISHSHKFNYNGTDTVVFSYWLKTTNSQNYGAVLCKSAVGGNSNYCFTCYTDSLFSININHNGAGQEIINIKYSTNHWNHVVVSFIQKQCSVFVNGVYVKSANITLTPPVNSSPTFLGNDTDGAEEYYKGLIDDLRVYRKRLTSQEILTLYHENGWN